jgi:hypothetical protein
LQHRLELWYRKSTSATHYTIWEIPNDYDWHSFGFGFAVGEDVLVIDGVEQTPLQTAGTAGAIGYARSIGLFRHNDQDLAYMSEYLDHYHIADLRLWNHRLDLAELVQQQTAYGSALSHNESGVIYGAWLMNDGSGNVAADRSTAGRTLTITTGSIWRSGNTWLDTYDLYGAVLDTDYHAHIQLGLQGRGCVTSVHPQQNGRHYFEVTSDSDPRLMRIGILAHDSQLLYPGSGKWAFVLLLGADASPSQVGYWVDESGGFMSWTALAGAGYA